MLLKAVTYLNIELDSYLVNDFEEHVCEEYAQGGVAQERDKVPDAAVTLTSQFLQVHCQDEIQEMSEAGSEQLLPDIKAEYFPGASLSRQKLLNDERGCADEGEQKLDEDAKKTKELALSTSLSVPVLASLDIIIFC